MQPTTVVNVQPNSLAPVHPPREWTHGLCSCCDDCREFLCAYFCPICYMCELTTRINESCCSLCFGGMVPMRTKVRTERKIEGSIVKDFCTIAFCSFCAIVQMSKEAKETRPLI